VQEKSTENATNMALKRDYARFGQDNVVSAEDCDGKLLKKQKVTTNKGTVIERDLCVDDR
jgi:hypothetical protein